MSIPPLDEEKDEAKADEDEAKAAVCFRETFPSRFTYEYRLVVYVLLVLA
jgi:hypothetical protein